MKSLAVFLPGSRIKKEGRIPLFFFFVRVSSERDRPRRKVKVGTAHEKTPVVQVLVGHQFGEFTVSVTLHEDVLDCLRS